MRINVDIADGSDELDELQTVVANHNKEHPENPITESQYVNNIVVGYFQNRVKNEYVGHAKKLTTAELKVKFGELSDIRSK